MSEWFEDDLLVEEKAKLLAEWIQNSKHLTVFTGAGISTSAGIRDFRGPQGCWTLRDAGKSFILGEEDVGFEQALPTLAHMALAHLASIGKLKCLITQNCDNLHRKSGFNDSNLAELHGNTYMEKCEVCSKVYYRDYDVFNLKETLGIDSDTEGDGPDSHFTHRHCEHPFCGGRLLDNLINFGEDLPKDELLKAKTHSKASDLMICIGSSLQVVPACDMPLKCKAKGGRFAIINLQNTPLDEDADLTCHALADDLFYLVMKELGMKVPPVVDAEGQVLRSFDEYRYLGKSGKKFSNGDVQESDESEDSEGTVPVARAAQSASARPDQRSRKSHNNSKRKKQQQKRKVYR